MKKTLLFAFAFCAMALGASAQGLQLINGMSISKISNDGKIAAATDDMGNAWIFDGTTNEYTIFEAGFDELTMVSSPRYFFGFGRACDDSGRMVGAIDECTPGYYQNGEWVALPIPEEIHKPGMMSQADDITPDGKRICGVLAAAGFGSDGTMIKPCIWDMKADGTYGDPVLLPCPELDFTGRAPQYVTARAMSADGKTIIGQVVDYSGFYLLPIVYKQNAEGEWSYDVICKNLVYNEEIEWPVIPNEPKEVDPTLYMDEASKAAYEQAVADHDAAVDEYWAKQWAGEDPGEYPEDVDLSLYVTDAAAFNAAVEAYNAAAEAYNNAINQFFEMTGDPNIMYGHQFEFNTLCLSADGRYYGALYGVEGEPDPDDWWGFPSFDYKAVFIDLQDGNKVYECPVNNCAPTCFLADNTMVLSNPANDYTRDAYIWKLGQEPVSLLSYLETANPTAAQELKEEWTHTPFDGYDENWEPLPGEPVCMLGTCVASPDGTVWGGWQSNNFMDVENWYLMGWYYDLKTTTAISNTKLDSAVKSYTVTNMAGVVLYRGADTAAARQALSRGVNIVTTLKANGETESFKVTKK